MLTETPAKVPVGKTSKLSEIVVKLSEEMLGLAPGPLAELRRMDADTPGTSAYWRLASRCDFLDDKADAWMQIVKIMAILTPKGQRQDDHQLHNAEHGLGAALCDGGSSAWPGDTKGSKPRPFYSEERLACFLAQPKTHRAETLERIARTLAPSRTPDRGVNCIEIARLLLQKDHTDTLRTIARDYYGRLDKASRSLENKDERS